MLQFSCQATLDKHTQYELLVLPFWEGPAEAADLSSWKHLFGKPLDCGDFKGKLGESLLIYDGGRILLLGLGKKESVNAENLRRAYSCAVRMAQSKKAQSIHLVFPRVSQMANEDALCAVAEGVLLTNHTFSQLKHETLKENPVVLLDKAVLVGLDHCEDALLAKLSTIAAGVYLVRELVNGNADDVTPKMLVDTATSLVQQTRGLSARILDKKDLEKEKMGLLLAVNRGSALDPYLITLSYQGNPASKEHIVLIGKGITYDTGGLALKPPDNMVVQKSDMAGAATVLAAIQAAAALQLKINVTAVAPVTENAIDAKSYKLGDVYRSMSGKMVEVNNTDAEGRLVLADAITYAIRHLHPTAMIDVASLTGGIIVALGEEIAGLFTTDDQLANELSLSSAATGERLWRMPLYPDYKETLKSDIADLLNSPGRNAQSMTAALFIQEFTDSLPWAHIDFAGPCYQSKPKFYNTAKGTGYGLRLLVDFLERRSS